MAVRLQTQLRSMMLVYPLLQLLLPMLLAAMQMVQQQLQFRVGQVLMHMTGMILMVKQLLSQQDSQVVILL